MRFTDGPEIVVAEGIESALSCVQALNLPAYPALSWVGIKSLQLPRYVRRATVFADGDDSGEGLDAAYEAARRWCREGRDARVTLVRGADANDLLRRD